MEDELVIEPSSLGIFKRVGIVRLKGGRANGTVAFSNDGAMLLAPRVRGWARIWCTRTGAIVRSFEIPDNAIGSSFSSCGRFHSTRFGYSVTVRWFGSRTKHTNFRLEDLPDSVSPVWRSARRAGLGSDGVFNNGPLAFDLASSRLTPGIEDGLLSLDSALIPSAVHPQYQRVFRRTSLQSRVSYGIRKREIALLSSQDYLVSSAGGTVVIASADQLFCSDAVSAKALWSTSLPRDIIAFRIRARSIVCLLSDYSICLINLKSGLLKNVVSCDGDPHVLAADIGLSGARAAWACSDGTLRIWRQTKPHEQLRINLTMSDPTRLKFINLQHALVASSNSIEVYNTTSGKQIWSGSGHYLCSDGKGGRLSVHLLEPEPRVAIVSTRSGRVTPTEVKYCEASLFSRDGRVIWLLSCIEGQLTLNRVVTATGICEARVQLGAMPEKRTVYDLTEVLGAPWPAVSVRMHPELPTVADKAFLPIRETALKVAKGRIEGFRVLQDGLLAGWSSDSVIRVWDVLTGDLRTALQGHEDSVLGVVPLPGGLMASWSRDMTIRIWDLESGDERSALRGHDAAVSGALLLPDGSFASWSVDGAIRIWDVVTGSEKWVMKGHQGAISGVMSLPDGLLASWSVDRTIRIWNLATGSPSTVLSGHQGSISGITVLPDGGLASWSDDQTIRIWDVSIGLERMTLRGHEGSILGVVLLADGDLASWSFGAKTIRIWDLGSGNERAVLSGHEASVSTVVTLPNGLLASCSADKTIRIWKPSPWAEHAILLGHSDCVNGLSVSPEGSLVSWSNDKTIRVWNIQNFEAQSVLRGDSRAVAEVVHVMDGVIASRSQGSGKIWCWNVHTGSPFDVASDKSWHWKTCSAISVSPDGQRAAVSHCSEDVWEYDLHCFQKSSSDKLWLDGGFMRFRWLDDSTGIVAIDSKESIRIISGSERPRFVGTAIAPKRAFRVMQIDPSGGALVEEGGQVLLVRPDGIVAPISNRAEDYSVNRAFSKTGRYIWRIDAEGSIVLIESRSMQIVMSFCVGKAFVLSQLSFSQDDEFLAVLSVDGEFRVFDLRNGLTCGIGKREAGGADALFLSRDAAWLHVLQNDCVEVWNIEQASEDSSKKATSVLRVKGIPAADLIDLSVVLEEDLEGALRDLKRNGAYRSFVIPKKSGGIRKIEAPRGALFSVQKELSILLQAVHDPAEGSHGFVEGRSIVSNAECHLGRRWVLNVDLRDFFASVTEARVRGLFRAPPFDLGAEAAKILARVCCHNGGLPQGAPTSPVLANFSARHLDFELRSIATEYGLSVTRYADDITLSSDAERFPTQIARHFGGRGKDKLTIVGPVLERAIVRSGFAINPLKTRLQYRSERQVVTGLVVNARPSPMRGHIKLVRALIHAWESRGLVSAAEDYFKRHPTRLGRAREAHKVEDFRSTVYGHLSFLHMVRGKDDRQFISFCRRLRDVDSKAPPVFVRETLKQVDGIAGITQ